jgi:hypothetical protein
LSKLEDNLLHVHSPCGFWGDQMLFLFSAYYHMESQKKDGVIIHTGKDLWNTHAGVYSPAQKNIFHFWSCFDFVKGIIFDMNQRSLNQDAEKSLYNVFPLLNHHYEDDKYKLDISKKINFNLFPSRFENTYTKKIAVFQPVSLANKPEQFKQDFICKLSETIKIVAEKGYTIIAIGSASDREHYEALYHDTPYQHKIVKLFDKINMFQAIDLVMNHAELVVSCCSWSGWYGIASRTKTVMALGPLMEKGKPDEKYVNLMKNKDIFFMDYSSKKEQTDLSISNWIANNV